MSEVDYWWIMRCAVVPAYVAAAEKPSLEEGGRVRVAGVNEVGRDGGRGRRTESEAFNF